jgi:glutamine amidotransferase
MCRLLGIVATRPVDFRVLLAERPRSLAALGEEHRDGWGLAAFDRGTWQVTKGVRPASHDERFHRRARSLRGELLVSHVRKRTVGVTRLANSHPFVRGRWVFAHNGTIEDRDWLRRGVSPARAQEIRGDTDSELFFAHVLTRLDESPDPDAVLTDVAEACRARARFGSFNFLLSDGTHVWVHRFGRGLFTLERGDAGGGARTPAVFVASEPMTDEPWRELDDGSLHRIERAPALRVVRLA